MMHNNPFELIFEKLNRIENKLGEFDFQFHSTIKPEADQLLTIQQAASLLSLSVPTLYALSSNARIPVSKKGKRLYFSKQELTDWIKQGRRKTQAESEAESIVRFPVKTKGGKS